MGKQITLNLYGEVHNLEMEEDETILDAALRNGVDAPYACMSGTCNSSQASVLEGEVHMEDADALTEDEIASGEILTCCAKAKTDKISIKYPE